MRIHATRLLLFSSMLFVPMLGPASTATSETSDESNLSGPDPQPAISSILRSATTRFELSYFFGSKPAECTAVNDQTEICHWNVANLQLAWEQLAVELETKYEINVVCELPRREKDRSPDACSAHRHLAERTRAAIREYGIRGDFDRVARAASERLRDSKTPIEMSRTLGQAPSFCEASKAAGLHCGWIVTKNATGHDDVMMSAGLSRQAFELAWYNQPAISIDCRFPIDGNPRRPDSCRMIRPGASGELRKF